MKNSKQSQWIAGGEYDLWLFMPRPINNRNDALSFLLDRSVADDASALQIFRPMFQLATLDRKDIVRSLKDANWLASHRYFFTVDLEKGFPSQPQDRRLASVLMT